MSIMLSHTAFENVAARYIRHQYALGKHFERQHWVIGRLLRFVAQHDAQDLNAEQFEAWCRTRCHTSPNSRRSEALIIRKLCLYRRRTEPDCFVPDPLYFPRRVQSRLPVILDAADIIRMLQAIEHWPEHPQHPLRKPALRIAVTLLYTTGLRHSELLSLTLSDVDLVNRTLRIRESKFHKSRLVPLSATMSRELRNYLKVRLAAPWDIAATAPLLGHHHGSTHFRPFTKGGMGRALRDIVAAAGVRDAQGSQPHVHDFRHSFAVQALLRWYRAGDDVQAKLPQLSIYMGHVSIVSTAYYLHLIPQIAAAANRRFERHFAQLTGGGVQ